jgi:Rad3-related DNA helicase
MAKDPWASFYTPKTVTKPQYPAPKPKPKPKPTKPRDPQLDRIPGTNPMPEWVRELRPHQWEAINTATELFKGGVDVVFIDAPTGSGKTLIGEVTRRMVQPAGKSMYVCSSLTLQDQFLADFDYSAVLKGRTNYTPTHAPEGVTCGDCNKQANICSWCPDVNDCEYETAKRAAFKSDIAVVNTAYLLHETNHVGGFTGRDLVIVDEADVLEQELMRFVQFEISERRLKTLRLTPPKKGSHIGTLFAWMFNELTPALEAQTRTMKNNGAHKSDTPRVVREYQAVSRLLANVKRICAAPQQGWVRDNQAGPFVLKPVKVDGFGKTNLWDHADKWLCMSATIISPGEMAESLGLEETNLNWASVTVPMTFPVENRVIHAAGIANMTNKERDTEWPKMVAALKKVFEIHGNERILVHTVSYQLAEYLMNNLRSTGRTLITYNSAANRDSSINKFRRTQGAVMLAPSLDRGVDFKDDDCRVVVVAKVPFPNLGDSQVSARLHGVGGKMWYAVQTVRSLVQMTGRGVRSETDWCVTYILDRQFTSNVWKNHRRLFPAWWREAVDMTFPKSKLRD